MKEVEASDCEILSKENQAGVASILWAVPHRSPMKEVEASDQVRTKLPPVSAFAHEAEYGREGWFASPPWTFPSRTPRGSSEVRWTSPTDLQ